MVLWDYSANFWHYVVLPLQCENKRGGTAMNKNISNIVNYGDQIIATLECNGRRLASVNGNHFVSLEAVKRALINLAGHYAGLAILTVRNCTCGWREVSALATMRRSSIVAAPSMTAPPHSGSQYLIPWAS